MQHASAQPLHLRCLVEILLSVGGGGVSWGGDEVEFKIVEWKFKDMELKENSGCGQRRVSPHDPWKHW